MFSTARPAGSWRRMIPGATSVAVLVVAAAAAAVAQAAPVPAAGGARQASIATSTPTPRAERGLVRVGVDARVHAHTPQIDEALLGFNQLQAGALPALAAIDPRWARIDVGFEQSDSGHPVYDCATGAWDPGPLDRRVALAHRIGGQPELIVDYSPPCLAAGSKSAPPDLGANRSKWDALVATMARHEITAEGVRTFEIWNEPDWTFWTGTRRQYINLYADTAAVLERVARSAGVRIDVGGPAMADVGVGIDKPWLTALAAAAAAGRLPLDFVSWHLYANDPDAGPSLVLPQGLCLVQGPRTKGTPCWYNPNLDIEAFATTARDVRAVLRSFPTLHPALFLDEWNIDGEYDARQDGPYGAAFAAAALDAAQSAGIDRMAFFDTEDGTGHAPPGGDWGVLTASGTPKPVFETFRFWHDLSGTRLPVYEKAPPGLAVLGTSPSPTVGTSLRAAMDIPPRVGAVASRATGGIIRVLVYDFAAYDPTGVYGRTVPNHLDRRVSVTIEGSGALPYRAAAVQVSGAAREGTSLRLSISGKTGARAVFVAPGQSVTLLTFVPSRGRGAGAPVQRRRRREAVPSRSDREVRARSRASTRRLPRSPQ